MKTEAQELAFNTVQQVRKEVITFLILTLLTSSIFFILIGLGQTNELIALGLMWCPGLSALVTRLIYRKSIAGLAWKLCQAKYLILAFMVPIILCVVEYGIVWLSVPNSIDNEFAELLFSVKKIKWIIVNLIGNLVFALGEEIGWRGLLVRKLFSLSTFTKTSIIGGIIWAVWHYPVIIFTNYGQSLPIALALVIFTIGLICSNTILTWFTLKTESIWPAVVLHGAGNFFIQSIFDHLTIQSDQTRYLTGEFGLVGGIILLLAAFLFWRKRKSLKNHKCA